MCVLCYVPGVSRHAVGSATPMEEIFIMVNMGDSLIMVDMVDIIIVTATEDIVAMADSGKNSLSSLFVEFVYRAISM